MTLFAGKGVVIIEVVVHPRGDHKPATRGQHGIQIKHLDQQNQHQVLHHHAKRADAGEADEFIQKGALFGGHCLSRFHERTV